jgi:hypothetical protein
MKESKVIRILPKNGTQNVNIDIEQDFDYLEVLSLKILQKDAYRIFCSDKGVLVGKVTANGGFPIQNAKISIFIPLDEKDAANATIRGLYPFNTPNDTLSNGKRYNLLPRDKQLNTPADHQPVGTFPSKYDIMTHPDLKYIHEKYYKYTTTSNENGDYMFFGIPSGTHIVHCDVDISDIGTNSVTPADLINLGYSPYLFNSDVQFKSSNDLNQLAQIVGLNNTVYVNPFWGDPDQCEFGLTRLDFAASRFVSPKGYLIGSFYTDTKATDSNSFVPQACWQEDAMTNTDEVGFKAGVSRIVRANTLRTPRQVAADGEGQGHRGIIEAVRLDEDGIVEYVGKWETDLDGSFIIPLPLNKGKKIWDDDLQGWRADAENGTATYADYRFKFYFEGQGDFDDYGLPQIQLNAVTNRGILFAPNPKAAGMNLGPDGIELGTRENNHTFWAQPTYGPVLDYEYNMFDQFNNRIKEFTNYARIRQSSFYTVSQSFNLISDFDSAAQDICDEYPVNWWYSRTDSGAGGVSFLYDDNVQPDWKYNSIGTNPWIIARSHVYTDLYSDGNVTSKNLFPTNYMFSNYYMKCPSKQDTLVDKTLADYGGFVSNYLVDRRMEASYKGRGYYSYNATIVNGAGDSANGNSVDLSNSCTLSNSFRYGEFITAAIDTQAGSNWQYNGSMDGCNGCMTFGSMTSTDNFKAWPYGTGSGRGTNGTWYNPEGAPYYGQSNFTQVNPANTVWDGNGNPNNGSTITGNIMMGGFVAPFAARYSLAAFIFTTCTHNVNDWIAIGLSYCDSTTTDCNNNANWTFSGDTAFYGDTNSDGNCFGIAPVDFSSGGLPSNSPVNWNTIPTAIIGNENGRVEWKGLALKEGMGLRVTIRPSLADSTNFAESTNLRGSSQVGVCYYCAKDYGASTSCAGQAVASTFEVTKVLDKRYNEITYDRNIDEPITGSLYFPQYAVGGDPGACCSRSASIWTSLPYGTSLSIDNRVKNSEENALMYAGEYSTNSGTEFRYYNDQGGDPMGGAVIQNGKYYNLNTIGEVMITEITKDIPNFQQGINQWASIDRELPSSSAHPTQEMNELFNSRENNQEDFDTNGNGTGLEYYQHKYFIPYDNLLFRTGQQWPRDENEDGTEILCPDWAIPSSWDWASSAWSGMLIYPVQPAYNPNGYKTFSNYHVFRISPVDMQTSPQWERWIRRVPKQWNDDNTFWWSTIQPVGNQDYLGFFNPGNTINGDQSPFNNDKGANNAEVKAYPMRRYYYFSVYHNLSPAETIKRMLGYKTNLIEA